MRPRRPRYHRCGRRPGADRCGRWRATGDRTAAVPAPCSAGRRSPRGAAVGHACGTRQRHPQRLGVTRGRLLTEGVQQASPGVRGPEGRSVAVEQADDAAGAAQQPHAVQPPADVEQPVVVEQPPADGVDGAVTDRSHGVEDGGLHRVPAGELRRGQVSGGVQAEPSGPDRGRRRPCRRRVRDRRRGRRCRRGRAWARPARSLHPMPSWRSALPDECQPSVRTVPRRGGRRKRRLSSR